MIELIVTIILMALIGSLGVPVIVLGLARFGYFEPVSVRIFGRTWHFAPKRNVISTMGRGTQAYKQESWVMAGTVSAVLMFTPGNYSSVSFVWALQAAKTQTLPTAGTRAVSVQA
jgi:hypothetical protein